MNVETKVEEPTTQEQEQVTPTPRSSVASRISEAKLPSATKKFAAKLLTENHNVGGMFGLSMPRLRKLRSFQTNIDVLKALRNLRAAGLMVYEIDHKTQFVSMRFVVK